jgi:hypothetical protein
MYRKIDAYKFDGKNYVYKWSSNTFKTCREFKEYLYKIEPNSIFKIRKADLI